MATDTATETPPQTPAVAPAPGAAEPKAPENGAAAPAKKAKGDAKAMPDKKAKAEKHGKGEKQGKGEKKGKGAKTTASDGDGPSVAAHPRAARGVARAKGWGALAGFVLGGYLSLPTNTIAAAGLRALLAGVVCWVAAWAGSMFVWRRLVMLEIKGREQQIAAVEAANATRELPPAPVERPRARSAA